MAITRALPRIAARLRGVGRVVAGAVGGPRIALWAGMIVAAAVCLLPLRFAATAHLVFKAGAPPPAAVTRGIGQVLASRDMAREVARRLDAADLSRLTGGPALFSGAAEAAPNPQALAARRILRDLDVRPVQGGRGLSVMVSAGSPGLAARLADAYVAAFLALEEAARAEAGPEATLLPPLRAGARADARWLPEPPRPLALIMLALAAMALWAGHRLAVGIEHPAPEAAPVPVQLSVPQRVFWLDRGTATGLGTEAAVARLLPRLENGQGRLVLVSADDPASDAAAALALALARHLAAERRVVMVALDGGSQLLSGLVSDSWAAGVGELLFGVAGFAEALHRDTASHAHLIPPGRDLRPGPDMLAAERLPVVLEALRRTYDHVIVAAPSLVGVTGVEEIAALAPLVVCAQSDAAPATAAVESFDALAAAGFAGVVMLRLADGSIAPDAEPVPSLDSLVEAAPVAPLGWRARVTAPLAAGALAIPAAPARDTRWAGAA
mgnify:CR=1 FL=1